MKPKYSASKLQSTRLGASLVTAITICLSGSAFATTWEGDVSADWNENTNWTLNNGTGGSNAIINIPGGGNPPFIATISANLAATPVDIIVGNAGNTGALRHTAGNASTGSGNWMFVGTGAGSNGTYNLADTSGTGGTLTGFGRGTGSLIAGGASPNGGRLYVGDAGGTGALNMHTEGSITVRENLYIAAGTNSIGTVKVDSGTLAVGNNLFVGDGTNANGELSVGGGSVSAINDLFVGSVGIGELNIDNGAVTAGLVTDACWTAIGRVGGNGSLNMSGGSLLSYGTIWVARDTNSTGTMTLTGGAVETSTHGEGFVIAESGGTNGTVLHSGGTIRTNDRDFVVARNGGGTGTYTISGEASTTAANFLVAVGAGTTGNVNFDGGTLQTSVIDGGAGTSNVNFNGTQIIATVDSLNFISDLTSLLIEEGGLKVNSNGKNLVVAQALNGLGGITKSGLGTLTLNGFNFYSGETVISGGKLVTTTFAQGSGAFTLSTGASLGIVTATDEGVLNTSNASFASGSSLDLNLGNIAGNSTSAPLNVSGNLVVSGPVTVNITDSFPAPGIIPLVQYVPGSKTGSGNFVLGTLPPGVVIQDNQIKEDTVNGLFYVNVVSVALPRWEGNVSGIWDTTTQNWVDLVSDQPTTFANNASTLFNDAPDVAGGSTTDVVLNSMVTPGSVTFDNSTLNYTLTGSGKITGSTGLLKRGTAGLTVTTANDFTGVTTLEAGTLSVNSLAPNVPSPIGMTSADPANLVFSGGTLNYAGILPSTTRGFSVAAADTNIISGLSIASDFTIAGRINATVGKFVKTGSGTLTLTHPGPNVLAVGSNVVPGAYRVAAGGLVLEGAGNQTNSVTGEMWIGSEPGVSANLVLNNTTLNTSSWLVVGIGNGNGAVSSLTATNSTIQSVNFSTGFNLGLADNDSDQTITLNNTNWTNNGISNLAEGPNSTTNMVIAGTSSFVTNGQFRMGFAENAVGNLTIQDSGSLTKTGGWMAIGNSGTGVGVLTVKDSGTLTTDGALNIGDVDSSTGTLNIQGSAVVTNTDTIFVGKNTGTTGTINLDGGTLNARLITENAAGGTSTFNFNGGLLRAGAANAAFMSLLDTVSVKAGGARIDSNGQNIGVTVPLVDGGGGGGLNKSGLGTLTLSASNTYTGNTTVTEGTLSLDAPNLSNTATLTIGTAAASPAILNLPNVGTDVVGSLVIDGVTQPDGLYDAANSGGAITGLGKIQVGIVADPFLAWINGFSSIPEADRGRGDDPDGDNQTNGMEYALGGIPNNGGNNAKIYTFVADSNDAETASELLMTIAVRSGAPAFTGTPSPSATFEGFTYTIEGSTTLSSFPVAVNPVAVVAPPAPNATAPAGYEYRTFSLSGSNGTPDKGFLRVKVSY